MVTSARKRLSCCSSVWVCWWCLVETRAYKAMRSVVLLRDTWGLGGEHLVCPAQQELLGAIPAPLSIRVGNGVAMDLPGSVHGSLLPA